MPVRPYWRRPALNHQLRWPFARGDGDLPLPKPVRSAILAPNSGKLANVGLSVNYLTLLNRFLIDAVCAHLANAG
jgi:hypothetical protein